MKETRINYKKLYQEEVNAANELRAKLRANESKKEVTRYSAKVFCANCGEVHGVSISSGVAINVGDCINCRVRGQLHLVTN